MVSIIYDSRRTGGRAIAPRAGSTSAVVVSSTQRERADDEARAPPLGVARARANRRKFTSPHKSLNVTVEIYHPQVYSP